MNSLGTVRAMAQMAAMIQPNVGTKERYNNTGLGSDLLCKKSTIQIDN